jgi:hypothetical protein
MYKFAGNEGPNLNELRERLRKMSDAELLRFGQAAKYMCSSHANFGNLCSMGKSRTPSHLLPCGMWTFQKSSHLCLPNLLATAKTVSCSAQPAESLLSPRNVLRDVLLGHENREMGTRYAKQLVENVEWRKEWAEKIGLGFNLTSLQLEVGKPGQLLESKNQPAKAA